MSSLFNIGREFASLYEMANDTTADDNEALAELFNSLEVEMIDKFDATQYIIKELKADAVTLSDEIKRLQDKKKALENKAERLRELIATTLETSGQIKLKGKFTYSIVNKISFNFDEVSLFGLDREFIRVKEELDKTKMTEFIKLGGAIDGVKLEDKKVLTIR
jgi:FtsZ-binding cell division protein ZapB